MTHPLVTVSGEESPTAAPAAPEPDALSLAGPREDYNAVPYPRRSQPWTHPRRMAGLAALIGLDAPDPYACRVLEIGCATGSNLIPIAVSLPGSTFVGFDLAEQQIAQANADIARLGLTNIEMLTLDVRDVAASTEERFANFDYIICHGIYSWVPPEASAAILALIERALAPDGIAYVSFNVNPGWHLQEPVRQAMLYHTRTMDSGLERGRAAIQFLQEWVAGMPEGMSGQEGLLRGVLDRFVDAEQHVDEGELSYLLHEYLADHNHAFYFHEFAADIAAHGLQYLSDADISSEFPRGIPEETVATIQARAGNLVEMLQYLDLFTFRMFRRSLLVRAGRTVPRQLDAQRLLPLYLHSLGEEELPSPLLNSPIPLSIVAKGTTRFSSNQPLAKAALRLLAAPDRKSWRIQELIGAARDLLLEEDPSLTFQLTPQQVNSLLQGLLHGICTSDFLLAVNAAPPPYALDLPERPIASPWARLQADSESTLTTLRLERIEADPMERDIIASLDGRVSVDELIERWLPAVDDGRIILGRPPMTPAEARAFLPAAVRERVRLLLRAGMILREDD